MKGELMKGELAFSYLRWELGGGILSTQNERLWCVPAYIHSAPRYDCVRSCCASVSLAVGLGAPLNVRGARECRIDAAWASFDDEKRNSKIPSHGSLDDSKWASNVGTFRSFGGESAACFGDRFE